MSLQTLSDYRDEDTKNVSVQFNLTEVSAAETGGLEAEGSPSHRGTTVCSDYYYFFSDSGFTEALDLSGDKTRLRWGCSPVLVCWTPKALRA